MDDDKLVLDKEDGYTIEDLEKEIEWLTNKIALQKREMVSHIKKAKSRSLLAEPKKNETDNDNVLSKLDEVYQWRKYKYYLYTEWQDSEKGILVRNPSKDIVPSILFNIILIAIVIGDIISKGISNFSFIEIVRCLALMYVVKQVVYLIASTYTYVIKPNKRLKAYDMREYKKLKLKIQELESQLKLKCDLLDAAKVSAIRPKEVMSNIKLGTNNNMRSEVDRVRKTLVPNMTKVYSKRFICILDKCDELLNLCSTDGAALNEISNIYNILIQETANVVIKYTESGTTNEIDALIDNFEAYLDRKLNKYKSIRSISLNSDVNALNNIFKSDY